MDGAIHRVAGRQVRLLTSLKSTRDHSCKCLLLGSAAAFLSDSRHFANRYNYQYLRFLANAIRGRWGGLPRCICMGSTLSRSDLFLEFTMVIMVDTDAAARTPNLLLHFAFLSQLMEACYNVPVVPKSRYIR